MDYKKMKKWVAALRSGKYKKGTSFLKNEKNEYCCLGVAKQIRLCQAANRGNSNGNVSYNFLSENSQSKLIILNDVKKWSFKSIATYIEKNWKNL